MKKLEVKKFGKLKLNKESLSMLKGGAVLEVKSKNKLSAKKTCCPCVS